MLVVKLLVAVCLSSTLALAATSRFLDCTDQSTSIEDCNYMAYAGRVVGYVALGLILAVFMLLTCPFYYCFKYCCNCCGGRSATMGCCCGCSAKPAIYSTLDIIRPKIYVIFILGLAIGSSAWGYFSTTQTTAGLNGLANTVNATPTLLVSQLDLISSKLTVLQYDSNTDSVTTSNLFSGSDLQTTGEKMKKDLSGALSQNLDTFKSYVVTFSQVMFGIFAVPIVLSILAGFFAICNIRTCFPMLTVAIMFFMGFTMWLSHGVFNAVALVSGDLCAEVHGITQNQKTILKPVTQCNDTLFSSFLTSFSGIESSVATKACTQLQALCYDNSQSTLTNINNGRVYNCGSGFSCNNVLFGDVVSILNGGMYVHATVATFPSAITLGYVCYSHTTACTPAYCADECVVGGIPSGGRSTVGKASKNMYVNFLAAYNVSLALDTIGGQYGSCDSLMQLVLSPFDSSCQDFANGSMGLRNSTGLSGITAFAFIFVLAWGSKRFIALPEDDGEKEYEMGNVAPHDVVKNPLAAPQDEPASRTTSPAHSPKAAVDEN